MFFSYKSYINYLKKGFFSICIYNTNIIYNFIYIGGVILEEDKKDHDEYNEDEHHEHKEHSHHQEHKPDEHKKHEHNEHKKEPHHVEHEHKAHHEEHHEHSVHHKHEAHTVKIKKKIIGRVHSLKRQRNLFFATTVIFLILSAILILRPANTSEEPIVTTNGTVTTPTGNFVITILNDERCTECIQAAAMVQQSLAEVFPDAEFMALDYSKEETKQIMEETGIATLPAVLFNSNVETQENYAQVQQYLEVAGDYQNLKIGSSYDPTAEICDNSLDDTGNGLIDCEDPDCVGMWYCDLEKQEVPKVELFVMSHCPYGTQIEKGILPVVETLGDKIDFELKFCDYAMHSEVELREQLTQYCIQEEQNDKFIAYLTCFLGEGDSESCLTETSIDTDALDTCVANTDDEYKVMENFADQSTWKGSFPTFNIFKEEVDEYGVGGSPTFVLNEVNVPTGRSAAALLTAICQGFTDKPDECNAELSTANPAPGFGFDETTAAGTDAQCG